MEDAVYREFLVLEKSHWWFRGRRAIFISLLDKYLGRDPGSTREIMDLGCGVGRVASHIAPRDLEGA